MDAARLAERLRERFPDVVLARDEVTIVLERDAVVESLSLLRDEPDLAFSSLSDVACTDWPGREPRMWIAYHLLSPEHRHRVRAKAGLPQDDLRIASVTELFPTADWHEREIYDFFGVVFEGHPDLRRIELPDDWEGHPLRKDHSLGGVRTQFKGAFVPPPDARGL